MEAGRNPRAAEGIRILRESRSAYDGVLDAAALEYRQKKSEQRREALENQK